jgi:hypothetical protein
MMQAGGPQKPLSLVVGSAEMPLLRKQTADFRRPPREYGLPVTYEGNSRGRPFHDHA